MKRYTDELPHKVARKVALKFAGTSNMKSCVKKKIKKKIVEKKSLLKKLLISCQIVLCVNVSRWEHREIYLSQSHHVHVNLFSNLPTRTLLVRYCS